MESYKTNPLDTRETKDILATGTTWALRIAAVIASVSMAFAPAVAAAVAFGVAVFAWSQVHSLFARLGASPLERVLAGAASVGMLAVCVGLLVLARANRLRALALMFGTAWVPLVVSLVALESSLRAGSIFTVPDALTSAGGIIAGILAALALVPLVAFLVAARHKDDADERGALAYYLSNTLKAVLLAATASANAYFGIAQGVNPFVALFVAVVLECAFLVALTRAREGGLHVAAMVAFGAALAVVAVETLSVLSGLAALPGLAEAGKQLYLLTPAAGIAYIVLAALTDRHNGDRRGGEVIEAEPVRIERPSALRRLADRVRTVRDDWAEVRAALAGGEHEQLPAASVTVARDVPAVDEADDGADAGEAGAARRPKSR